MEPFYEHIREENRKLFQRGLPYSIFVILGFMVLALFLRSEAKQLLLLGALMIVLAIYYRFHARIGTGAISASVLYGLLVIWGIARISLSPETLSAHIPLVAILFAFSAMVYLQPRTSFILHLGSLALVSLSIYGQSRLPFFPYFMSYLLVMTLSVMISHFHLKVRRLLYEQEVKVQNYSKELERLNRRLSMENLSLSDVLEDFNTYGEFIMAGKDNGEKEFLTGIFKRLMTLIPRAQRGTLYTFDEGKVRFLTGKGYDLEALNQLGLPRKAFELPNGSVQVIHEINQRLKDLELSPEKRALYEAQSSGIRETLVFQIETTQDMKIGVSLDLLKNSPFHFTDSVLKKAEAYRALLQFYYTHHNLKALQNEFTEEIVRSLIKFLEIHDPYTKGHSVEVAELSSRLAQYMGLSTPARENIYWAALLHDIGKLHINPVILNKKGPLTEAEYEKIKEHPTLGADALEDNLVLKPLATIIRYHHEHYDGGGYPEGLRGEQIPLESRIISVADSFEAMTSDRSYRTALDDESAAEELKNHSGTQFDPQIVDIMLQILHKKKS